MDKLLILITLALPLFGGLSVALIKPLNTSRNIRNAFVLSVLTLEGLLLLLSCFLIEDSFIKLFSLSQEMQVALKADRLGLIFASVMSAVWLIGGFFSFEYMKHEQNEKQYYAFYLLTLSALMGLCFAASLITMYMLFEAVTLLSLAFVIHSRTKEAIGAGVKYLIYSIAGATMGLLAIFFISTNIKSPFFESFGTLKESLSISRDALQAIVFVSIVGFCAKAGMFPLHGWLPSAHPVAPSPASAVLSGVITKAGVLCVIRLIYFSVGADFLRGTWVQNALIALSLITIFMGSSMALNEKMLKKRLAYSSVSQLSYILCGLFILSERAFSGAMLHFIFHAVMKSGLFLCAGAIILKTGINNVDDFSGLGKRMPVVFGCFTVFSLSLIGIPPLAGFLGKWHIALGAGSLNSNALAIIIPITLLISALLTAGYLLPPIISAFYGKNEGDASLLDNNISFRLSLTVLALSLIILGIFPNALTDILFRLAAAIGV